MNFLLHIDIYYTLCSDGVCKFEAHKNDNVAATEYQVLCVKCKLHLTMTMIVMVCACMYLFKCDTTINLSPSQSAVQREAARVKEIDSYQHHQQQPIHSSKIVQMWQCCYRTTSRILCILWHIECDRIKMHELLDKSHFHIHVHWIFRMFVERAPILWWRTILVSWHRITIVYNSWNKNKR